MNKIIRKYKNLPLVSQASVAYVICVFLQKGIQIITWPLFTRLLSLEQYGQYTLYVAWEEIVSVFLTLNLSVGIFPKAMELYYDKRKNYIATCQTIGLLLSAIFLAMILPFHKSVEHISGLPIGIIIVMFINVLTYLPIQLWESKCRFQNEYVKVVVVTAIYAVASPIFAIIFVFNSENKGIAMIIGLIIIPTIMGVFYFAYNYITSKTFLDKELFVFAMKSHLPLIAYFLSSTILNQCDRIMINYYCGKEKSAIYGVSYSLAMMITLISGALNNSFIPFLYENIKKNQDDAINKRSINNFILIVILVLTIIFMGPEVIRIVGGKKYLEAIWIISPVAGSVLLLFVSQLFIDIQLYFEEKIKIAVISVIVAVVNIILNQLCLPIFGYFAAGYTTLASYMLYMLLNYIVYRKIIIRENISFLYNVISYIRIFIMAIILVVTGVLTYNYIIVRYLLLSIIIFAFLYGNRLLKKIRSKR